MRIYIFITIILMNVNYSQLIPKMNYEEISDEGNNEISPRILVTDVLEDTIDPDNYIVGPGDQFAFNMLSADGMVNLELIVTPSGEILIPAVGKVHVDGITLSKAINSVIAQCKNKYSNATIHIALTKIRKFRVLAKGPVDKPGYIDVTPIMRISELFELVYIKKDELSDIKVKPISRRNILLWRDNIPIRVDLVKFNMFGDNLINPQLKQGDVVEFTLQEKYTGIYGGIKIPGKYELVEGESLYDLIQIAGGFTKNADFTRMEITRFITDIEKTNLVVNSINDASNFILQDEDHINIRIKRDYKRQDLVTVDGEVNYPGTYSIEPNVTTIGDLIHNCGGLTSKADLSKIQVNNRSISLLPDIELERINFIPEEYRSNEEKAYMKARIRAPKGIIVSSEKNFTEQIYNFPLNRGDVVYIPEAMEYIEILGAVIHPGRYPFIREYSVDNYIQLAGGITETATKDRYIVRHSTGQRIPLKNNSVIENGDVIFIAEKMEYSKWERFKEIMAVAGQAAALIVVIQNAMGL